VYSSVLAALLVYFVSRIGLVLQAGFTLITVKLIFILLFTWYSSPAAGHALIKAAHKTGLRPLLRKELEQEAKEEKSS